MADSLSYHLMGIAGLGMSAIAHVLIDQGQRVSGCDLQDNALTAELASRGAVIMQGHSEAHLEDVDALVISSAVRGDHPEVLEAGRLGVPVLKRADLWRQWSESKPTLAIAGTHGKTTTTAMAALVLARLGYDPAYIVPAGGPVAGLDRFARWGAGPFVIEADEYDRLLLGLLPEVAVITNVDWDHVDIYPSLADVESTFAEFARQVRRMVIVCDEDEGAGRVRAKVEDGSVPWQSYGFSPRATWHIADVTFSDGWTHFTLHGPGDEGEGRMQKAEGSRDVSLASVSIQNPKSPGSRPLRGRLQVPGRHNVLNAVSVVAAVAQFGVEPAEALQVLADYRGAARRFELKGEAQGVTFIDDYAHNPAKVAATLAAARMRYKDRRLVVYFQPHTFSRTKELLVPLAEAFHEADVVLVGDIYPSRERAEDFPGVDAASLVRQIPAHKAEAAGGLHTATARLLECVRPGDVVLTLGAGNGYQVGDEVRRQLETGGGAGGC